ncbi:MAG TPA: hypothetical protein VIM12_00720 [Noviherbaspirillum sp.]|jgi:hypothetical protein|uniref:hypothetical protein n=1 Tax=Noviherbaspirillum sp. TaxID=1926288 RepID=UPI002F9380A9
MKILIASVVSASALLSGCVAVPLGEPAVHVSGTVSSVGHAHPHVRPYGRPAGPPPRYWRDRDGDGVPNRHDRRPANPYRY